MNLRATIDAIVSSLGGHLVTALANAVSVIGFVITVLVYLDVMRIKKFYIFTGRVPDLARSLRQHASKISNYLNDPEGFLPQIQEELARAEVVLKSLKKKTDRQLKQSISRLLNAVRSYDPDSKDDESLRGIYLGMIKIEAEIKDLQKDRKWEMSS